MSGQGQILVRIRPQRIAILLSENTGISTFKFILNFLPKIWGGFYSPIIIVKKNDKGDSAKRMLSEIRPEIIICSGINLSRWKKTASQICQPRVFLPLSRIKKNTKSFMIDNLFGIIWTDYMINAEIQKSPQEQRKNLILHPQGRNNIYNLLMTATFGLMPKDQIQDYADALNSEIYNLKTDYNILNYIQICIDMNKKWSWRDFSSYSLQRQHWMGQDSTYAPTVVVMNNVSMLEDIALYWNMRMQFGPGFSGNIIMFPEDEIANKDSVKALSNWIKSSHVNSNYCLLITKTVSKANLESLARRLRPRLSRNKSEYYVDTRHVTYGLPTVLVYEHEEYIRPHYSDELISIQKVSTAYEDYLRSRLYWMCDLVKDSATNRAPFEICLPNRLSALQVLNAPSPPRFNLDLSQFGYGIDSMNIRLNQSTTSINFKVPSDTELIEEILRESDIKIDKDEKRIRYTQTIEMLGGLSKAASSLKSDSLRILKSFSSSPMTLGEIKSKAKIDKNADKKQSIFLEWADRLPVHAKNVAKRRYREYEEKELGTNADVNSIIQNLVACDVIKRKWKLDKCIYCDKEYWINDIKINEDMPCPGCSNKIILKDKIQIGYELNELVSLAMQEGITPVVQTARLLKNITSKGFNWLPGVKCSKGPIKTDFDIIAICDGHLIAAECKSLEDIDATSSTWEKIKDQLKTPIEIAKKCGIESFVFASLAKTYPTNFIENITMLADDQMAIEIFSAEDLERGYKKKKMKDMDRSMVIDDILPRKIITKPKRRRKKGSRRASIGF